MRKNSENPGQLTASKQVNDRVINNVSPSDDITVSPSNEPAIRGFPRYKLPLLRALGVPEEWISEQVKTGQLQVVD